MKKVVYIIPGFMENASMSSYQQIMEAFRSKTIKPIPIEISWKYKTMTNYLQQFFQQYKPNKNQETYLFGFSFGAMIALIASEKVRPKILILSSLSPYFKEDLPFLREWWKKGDKKRIKDFENHSFDEISKGINCKTILIAGEREPRELWRRIKDAQERIKNSKLITIPKARHNISKRDYLEEVKKVIQALD